LERTKLWSNYCWDNLWHWKLGSRRWPVNLDNGRSIEFSPSSINYWIGLKVYVDSPDMFSYYGLKFQVNRISGRHRNTGLHRLYEFCYLLLFDLWTSYLVRILFLQGCDSWFWEFPSSTRIFNELQYNLQVCQGFINVSESFSYKDSLFILATQGKKSSGI
jgi:hypothetical protein